MRILIISDTHGRTNTIQDVLEKVGEIDMLIHLGDICGDEDFIYEHCSCPVHMVAGNNDWASSLPMEDEFMIGRYKVFITHGHRYGVHYGTDRLQELVKNYGYDIVMYGHTHLQNLERYGGAYIVNPGSLSYPRDGMNGRYMILEFDQHGTPFFAENELISKSRRKRLFEDLW